MNAPVLTQQQELSLTLCDAWLEEFDLMLSRLYAKEPIYKPLSRLWDAAGETKVEESTGAIEGS
jgi:hypothetical protein